MIPRTTRFYRTVKATGRNALAAVLVFSTVVHATSVVEVSVEELLRNSALVFEGQVVDVQVRENSKHAIQTLVTFEILDVIKGDVPGGKLTLGFLGGTVAGRQLSVSNMHIPLMHEHGIYFVESTARTQVHPFYGWSQGHLLLEEVADGTERVFTRSGRPVTGIQHSDGKRPGDLSSGVARGLVTGDSGEAAAALDRREFKRLLRAMRW